LLLLLNVAARQHLNEWFHATAFGDQLGIRAIPHREVVQSLGNVLRMLLWTTRRLAYWVRHDLLLRSRGILHCLPLPSRT
jgi:hypothetical protein